VSGASLRTPPEGRSAYSGARHLRATAALLAVAIVLTAVAYPIAIVEFAELVAPSTANGALTHYPNGTVNSSRSLPPGTNTTVHLGAAGPPGAIADPASPPRGDPIASRGPPVAPEGPARAAAGPTPSPPGAPPIAEGPPVPGGS
jgi:K+-transporting ATPase, c chain